VREVGKTVLNPCASPGDQGDWWIEQHTMCTGSHSLDSEEYVTCSCPCHQTCPVAVRTMVEGDMLAAAPTRDLTQVGPFLDEAWKQGLSTVGVTWAQGQATIVYGPVYRALPTVDDGLYQSELKPPPIEAERPPITIVAARRDGTEISRLTIT